MSTIYLFDGSGGCDFCKAATGYSIDEEPIRPHPGCDCPIVEIDPADLPECELVLQDLIVDQLVIPYEGEEVYNRCDETADAELTISYDEDEAEGFDEGLRELVEAAGWAPPATEQLSGTIDLGDNRIHTVHERLERYVAIFEAQVAYGCTINGAHAEVPGGQKTGFYEKFFRLSIDRDSELCPGDSPGHEVPDLADDEALASYLGDEGDEDTG